MSDDRMDTGSDGDSSAGGTICDIEGIINDSINDHTSSDSDDGRANLVERMDEAFAIIQPDRARRKREEEEKRARTTYREDIYLRQKEKVRYGNLYNPYSDNDGVEYDPKKDETIFDNKKVIKLTEGQLKRKVLNAANSKRKKQSNTEALPDDPTYPFMTLVVLSQNGKNVLANLADKYNTQINVWMTLNNVGNDNPSNGDGNKEKKPDDSGNKKSPVIPWARYLRSGKVLRPTTPMIKRRKRDEPDMHGVVSDDWRPIEEQYKDRCAKRPRVKEDEEHQEPTERQIFANLGKPVPILMPADLKKSNSPVLFDRMDWQPYTNTSPRPEIRGNIVRAQAPNLIRDGATRDTAIQIHDSASEAENYHRRPISRIESLPNPIRLPSQQAVRPQPQQPDKDDDDNGDSSSDSSSSSSHNHEDEDPVSQITTAFANPIDFQHCGPDCDFCQDYRFPIFGYGRKQVTVARNPDDRDTIIELGDGHSVNHVTNKMCFSCVGTRLMIIRCKTHTFEPIPLPPSSSSTSGNASSPKVNIEDLEAQYITHLSNWEQDRDNTNTNPNSDSSLNSTKSTLPPFLPPCSLCIHPATHACRSFQHYARNLQPCLVPIPGSNANAPIEYTQSPHPDKGIIAQNPIKGCALKLCQSCYNGLEKVNFRFEKLKDVLKATGLGDHGENEGSRRADLEFLFKKGELRSIYRGVENMLGGK